MAYTKIHAIKRTMNKALKYIENPEKTDGQFLVSGYNVDPLTASIEYEMTAALAREMKADHTKTGGGNNLAYHMIQSFSPEDNVTPEQAHEIGKKLADEFLDGKYEYVVATHIDKGHIHNHIIFNAVSFYDYKKFNSQPYKTAAKIRAISDRLCAENELSVIQGNQNLGTSYKEWMEKKKDTSWKAEIRKKLNFVLDTATGFDEFKTLAAKLGVIVNDSGKHIKFQVEGQERWTRGNKLADNGRFEMNGLIEQLTSNKNNQEFLKQSIREVVSGAESFEQFTKVLKEKYSVTVRKSRGGELTYKLDDMNGSRVKERALGAAYTGDKIREAIEQKEFSFAEPEDNPDIASEYDKSIKTKVDDIDTRILLTEDNIDTKTVDGILLKVPGEDGEKKKVFIDNRHINFIETNNQYEIYLGEKYDYYFVSGHLNLDLPESKQPSNAFIKGESLIRTLERTNGVKPVTLEVPADDIQSLSPKGITISIPDVGIKSLFIENEYVQYDRLAGSCKVDIFKNWNYNYRNYDLEKKQELQNIKGSSIIEIINKRENSVGNSLTRKIAALDRRTMLIDTKTLAAALVTVRRENINQEDDFKKTIDELQTKAMEAKEKIKAIESRNEQYKTAVKALISYNKYLPIKQQLEKQSVFAKGSFQKKHESELLAFDFAAEQLEKLGVSSNVDSNKVINLIKEQEKKAAELTESLKETAARIEEIREAYDLVHEQNQGQPQKRREQEK